MNKKEAIKINARDTDSDFKQAYSAGYLECYERANELVDAAKKAKDYLKPDLVEPGRTVFWHLERLARDLMAKEYEKELEKERALSDELAESLHDLSIALSPQEELSLVPKYTKALESYRKARGKMRGGLLESETEENAEAKSGSEEEKETEKQMRDM